MSLFAPVFQNVSVRIALKSLKLFLLSVIIATGFLAVLGIIAYLIMKFDNWIEEDKKEL